MTIEIRNWSVVAASMEAQGATNSQLYIRAKALAVFRLFEIKATTGLTYR